MTDTMRVAHLRDLLAERRREMQDQVTSSIRDDVDASDADIQSDMDVSLLQMRALTLTRIDEAFVLLEAGEYGSCVECDSEISEGRLRALPFTVHCQACEERREHHERRASPLAERRGGLSLFPDDVGPYERPTETTEMLGTPGVSRARRRSRASC